MAEAKLPSPSISGSLGPRELNKLNQQNRSPPFAYQFLAGAVAGVSEVSIMYPLDVIKTRLQIQSTVVSNPNVRYTGLLDCARKIALTEGLPAFYRGVLAPLLMEAPKRATKFGANGAFGSFYCRLFNREKLDQKLSILTGASAGAVEAMVICPFEVVKVRMQNPANAVYYKGVLDCALRVLWAEGPAAFYRGGESTIWRSVVWNAGYFGCIFQIRALLPKSDDKGDQMKNDFVAGCLGGTVGVLVNTPFDVVKSRIQSVHEVPGIVTRIPWAFPALVSVYREEGPRALFKGLSAKMVRFCPGGGVLLVMYTAVMDLLMSKENSR